MEIDFLDSVDTKPDYSWLDYSPSEHVSTPPQQPPTTTTTTTLAGAVPLCSTYAQFPYVNYWFMFILQTCQIFR
ncbi:unnamed protein product, partial [Rotaria socialis]